MIKLHVIPPGAISITQISFSGEEEEAFTTILASRLLSFNYEVFVEEDDLLTAYEDFIYEPET